MQLVIDIDDTEYQKVLNGKWIGNPLADYIEKGIPLPKGHGRLIDADLSIKHLRENYCIDCDRRRGMKNGKLTKRFVYDIGDAPCRACDIGDTFDYIEDAPTIIEADGGE